VSAQKPVVVVGSINTDLVAVTARIPAVGETVVGTDFQIHPGGKGANQAVAVARLGYPVRLIGRLGSDTFGTSLRTHLGDVGVNLDGVATSEGSSGVAIIVVSEAGENSIVVTPGANALVTPHDLDAHIDILRNAGIVLTQLEIPIETVEYLAKICAREGVPLILDPAPAKELPRGVMANSAWFTPNETEAAYFAGNMKDRRSALNSSDLAALLRGQGCHGVLLKMGAQGVYVSSEPGLGELIPAIAVKAVDSTAAGDAFNGGFATALMLGKSPLESARFAVAVAGISVTRPGAQPSMPDRSEVEAMLASIA
jgi:ribokinase